jgi:hypothetical protein
MKSVEIANDIREKMNDLDAELETWIVKGNKAAAKRARKKTIELEKLFKLFRKASVADSK